MKYRYLGKTGLPVSRVCLGTLTFGNPDYGCDEIESTKIVKMFFEQGGNFFDTADAYQKGRSEEILGKAISDIKRDAIVIATKCFFKVGDFPTAKGLSQKHIIEACENSLRRLQTDYIDLYQIHGPDPITSSEEIMRALDLLVKQGKVRYIGCSNLFAWQIVKMNYIGIQNSFNQFVSGQYLYNLILRDIEREIIPACVDQNMGVLCWSPLAGGVLSGKYVDEDSPVAGSHLFYRNKPEVDRFWNPRSFTIMKAMQKIVKRENLTMVQLAIGWILKNIHVGQKLLISMMEIHSPLISFITTKYTKKK